MILAYLTARHPVFAMEAIMTEVNLERLGLWVFLMLLMMAALVYI